MSMHRYRFFGPTDAYLEQFLGTNAVAGGPVVPPAYCLRELDSETLLTDLDIEMNKIGFVRDDSSLDLPVALLQIKRAKLPANASAIAGTTFEEVMFVEFDSRGGSVAQIRTSVVASVLLGGTTRIVIDGGSFSDQVLLSSEHPILSAALGGGETYVAIPSTESETTYTVRVECASVALGTITPLAGSSVVVEEHTG